jgi:class 3 adenylate cyclase/tetratricopeptide (TPR) repeat protein
MRALYRAGRQADALDAYQEARRVLMDELGLEPSEELREVQQAILQHDATLRGRGEGAAERAPDRRTVTILFCDLVDSTRLARDLDPEVYRRLISRYFDLVREPIDRHGGTVEKFIGDAVMAVFGVPDLHEDDALRAVRAAAEIQDALRDEDWDVPLEARIGVSTGEVHVLSTRDQDLHVSGAAASIAAQLEERAPHGGVLVSEETHRLVRDAVRATPVDRAWRLDEVVAGAEAYERRLDAPLVGREEELRRLQGAYESALDEKHCRVVTVVGEAGIGKTRLMRELLTRARDDTRVLVGRCVSYGEGATYLPIAEIVKQATPAPSVSGIASLLGDAADADQIAQRVAELTGLGEGPAAPGEAFWAVRKFLESVANAVRTIVVFDDIHWAEPTLLDLIEYLGEWAQAPLLILCAARRELFESRPGWGGPTSTGFVVELDSLSAKDVAALVTRLADGPLDPEVESSIVEHAGGNPLFAEQLVALAAETPGLALDDPPATVEALIASRLDRLDPRELAVLRRAAVIGRRFSREELRDLTPDAQAETTQHHLAELAQRELVHPDDHVLRFHHVLVRDVAYRGIPKSERADLHERAARGLDRRDGPDEVIGYHFERAYAYLTQLARPDEHAHELAQQGGDRLGRAGIRAWKRADASAAINLLSRAVELTPDAAELACELAGALRVQGDPELARATLTSAIDASVASGDERVAVRARLELAFLKSILEPESADELLDLASAAIPVLESFRDDRSLGRAWLFVGHVKGGFRCEYGACEEATTRAAEHYRRAGWSPSTSLGDLAIALYFGPRDVESAIAKCEELLQQHKGDLASEANIVAWLGGLEAMRGRFEDARARVARSAEIHGQLGHNMDSWGRVRGSVEMLAGAPELAEQVLRQSCDILQRQGLTAVLATRAAELADAIYEQSRYDDARVWIDVARRSAGSDDLDASYAWRYVEAKVLMRQGGLDKAEEVAREAFDLIGRTDALNRQADVLVALAQILHANNGHAEALDCTRRALTLYELKGNVVSAERVRASLPAEAVVD